MGSWLAEMGFSPVLSLESSSTNKGNGAPSTWRPAGVGGTGGELDSRRTGMGGVTGGSICGRIWTLTAHQLDKAASQARLYWGGSLFLFYPQEENFIFFLYS